MAYNTPSVSLDLAREVAVLYIKAGIIPVLISPPGVGKTMTAEQIAEDLGARFHAIRLNNIAPEEVAGLQFIDRAGQHSTHLPPKWLPAADGSDGPVLIFIDEISQAPDENRKAIMSALLERYLGDAKLPDNCYFMAAGNSSEDGTNVYEFDRATADRFGIIKVRTDVESWSNDYARKNDIDLSIVAFLRLRPDAFEMSEELQKGNNVIGPSPRTWVAVNRFLKEAVKSNASEMAIRIGVMGKVGQEMGTAYLSVREQAMQLKTIRELIDMPHAKRAEHTPKTLEALWTYCQGMIWHATSIDRCVEVFDLLDSFREIDDVPFYETRFTVAEMVLQRAEKAELGPELYMNKALQSRMIKWRKEMDDVANAMPGEGVGEGETASMDLKIAA